jgi:nitrous oxidase accessory protein NosD
MKKIINTFFLFLLSSAYLQGAVNVDDLQAEIDAVSASSFKDTKIKVHGTHVGNLHFPAPTFPITIILQGNDEAVLEGTGTGSTITVDQFARVELNSLKVTKGIAFTNGGGIYNEGIMVIKDCCITDNYAAGNGGGIYNGGDVLGKGIMNIYNSQIDTNTAGEYGGGIFNYDMSMMLIKDSKIEHNSASIDGGGIFNLSTTFFFIHDSEVEHNSPNQITH